MAIFRCHTCGYLREVSAELLGKTVSCPKCKQPAPIHDTVLFIQKVLDKYMEMHKELHALRKQLPSQDAPAQKTLAEQQADMINLHNTTALTRPNQYAPIVQWFHDKQIQVDVDQNAVDTTGFFDEVAIWLGEHYDLLHVVSDHITHTQRKGYTTVTLNISKYSQQDRHLITSFCQELYEYSFVAKYFYKKDEQRIHLTLQTAKTITNFFNGEWLEWFAFMKLLKTVHDKQMTYSCLRSVTITFPNKDKQELDVFFLFNKRIPVCIECKSGEFRPMIEKYVTLRNRLHLDKRAFLLLVLGLSDEQAQGLTSMYDITFVNERNFLEHVLALLA